MIHGEGLDAGGIHARAEAAAVCGDYGSARAWLSRLGPRTARDQLVSVAADIWGEPGLSSGSAAFVVVSPDTEGAAAALWRAGRWFMRVVQDGRILSWEAVEDGFDPDAEDEVMIHSPNFVADPELTVAGPLTWVDTKGVLPAPMASAMVRLLVDALADAGVRAHVRYGHPTPARTGENWAAPGFEDCSDVMPGQPRA